MNKFIKYQAQTSKNSILFEVSKAKGNYIYDKDNKKYLDLVAGVSANVLGHSHPKIIYEIKDQLDKYMHVMVYGEFIQDISVKYCELLVNNLPEELNNVYLVNSGTEAVEGAMKLAKRITGRGEIISAKYAYHGNTQGSMSILGIEYPKNAFRPLIPNVKFIEFNNENDLNKITEKTACVILETIQGSSGFIVPENNYLKKVKEKCEKFGVKLILDEIQTGFGRIGKLFGFDVFDVIPDILVIGKAMGGGMPAGAFISSKENMDLLTENPHLGHITTFGGNPVISASCYATLNVLLESKLIDKVLEKENIFKINLTNPKIKEIRGKGLMLALMFDNDDIAPKLMRKLLEKGIITFLLLFEKKALRITPPLTITNEEIIHACEIINQTINEI